MPVQNWLNVSAQWERCVKNSAKISQNKPWEKKKIMQIPELWGWDFKYNQEETFAYKQHEK